ncbi:hypothetical protein [Finch poxvirus]|uniref:Uncharacterized protein n=2 Tax=unclassified Avipoxvirus TaxID=336487 RepID=A0AAT9UQH5_9POXV|nr:hypothetical protein [Finch poxvirus]UOX38929.1 hypothetical protein [Finch poxvirus]
MAENYKDCKCQCCCCTCNCRGELLSSWNNYKCMYHDIMISSDNNVKTLLKSLYGHFLFSISLIKDFFTIRNNTHQLY